MILARIRRISAKARLDKVQVSINASERGVGGFLLSPDAASRSHGKGLKGILFVVRKAGVLVQPSLGNEGVGQGEVLRAVEHGPMPDLHQRLCGIMPGGQPAPCVLGRLVAKSRLRGSTYILRGKPIQKHAAAFTNPPRDSCRNWRVN